MISADKTAANKTSPDKAVLRQRCLARRDVVAGDVAGKADLRAMQNMMRDIDVPEGAVVSAYWPIRSELDPRPAMLELATRGHQCALPVIAARDAPLIFRTWQAGDALDKGPFGTAEPSPDAPQIVPDVVIVPLVAFDEQGHRLGYGGGYYDRTLGMLRRTKTVLAVGFAYAGQEVQTLPVDAFDQKLDWIVTEKGTRSFI